MLLVRPSRKRKTVSIVETEEKELMDSHSVSVSAGLIIRIWKVYMNSAIMEHYDCERAYPGLWITTST